ncbi:unnamed protein product [Didymodactylos carnosus]|uniref:Uncharacterized protein n=1 Tax=Didymodactylos carnosus TaxID=1234261 RepID=A0A813X649_9BILA|nr:unnamed protein product [Didymodactylos carnosus]CAF0865177.1 unnamed protein product [Didymodactylos carnosus]CAF3582435.1 unnamed protein product [Didymodactylos carnosus]CAF3652689.1 unnamed protein product [Didymodactylos carnosus]
MTQFGTTDSATHLNRILPLPSIPSYVGRHPIYPKPRLTECSTTVYNPLFAGHWNKQTDNYARRKSDYHCGAYTYLGPEWFKEAPKYYATHQTQRPGTAGQTTESHYSFGNNRPQTVPNHTTRTSAEWSKFLDHCPERFEIVYPTPDDVNDLCFRNNKVQYDMSLNQSGRYTFQTDKQPFYLTRGISNRIEPVTNPYRCFDARNATVINHKSWVPYGNTLCRYQDYTKQNSHF